jgi:hypothetical protein
MTWLIIFALCLFYDFSMDIHAGKNNPDERD